ncbi:carboxymuconolactone decarboxylase [Arthrobacter crystallopoietes BAB-32]|uniref:Carboxymuconolactone decarboxylase n=1 Tax=Arthrobacter crystallopoietes BAB-32 TaxID=1246476 RepID=N1UYS4_9MICC|nr:carboxymuconolactone decarboxylase family protein [Arthrobacter crystallopoietes]EMY32929.1 carboxymuconolactone decarboxylase [Arthrobacter crystallopoietes BAB-32]
MARIPLEHTPGLLLKIMAGYSRRKYGEVLDPGLAMLHNRRVLFAWLRHESAIARFKTVPPTLKALAVMGAATTIGCSWCLDFGYWEYHHQGVAPAKLRAVPEWRTSTVYTPLERAVLEYAEAMTATPPCVSDELVDRLKQHLDHAQLAELTYLIAVENQRSRVNAAMGLDSQGFKETCSIGD